MSYVIEKNNFRNKQLDIIKNLKLIDFKANDTKNMLDILDKKNIISFTEHPLNTIKLNFSQEKLNSLIEQSLFTDMVQLLTHHEVKMNKLNEILMHEKIILNEYNNIIISLNNNEQQINEFIDFYSDYLKNNKGCLIRNEILKYFLDKILITKEEKENLSDHEHFNDDFFSLINKMNVMKENIEIVKLNSSSFSKTLLMSLKEHYSLIDEMVNEKIVIYLKNTFREKKLFNLKDYKNILNLLGYLKHKEQYLSFVLNEYTQMRKKFIEAQLRDKYIKLANKKYDEIFKNLNEDFIFYFIKEFILIHYFFDAPPNPKTITNETEIEQLVEINSLLNSNEMFNLLNHTEETSPLNENKNVNQAITFDYLQNHFKKICDLADKKDLTVFINNLNSILYIFEDLFFQNTQKSNSFYEVYKITLLSFYYNEQIEKILKENHLENVTLKLYLIILNYKKNYSTIFQKLLNETLKNLQKLKNNVISYLADTSIVSNNENIVNQTINKLIEDYLNIFTLYQKYPIKNDEIANPLRHETFNFLLNFFNSDQVKNETNIDVLFKIINLVKILNENLVTCESSCVENNEIFLNELIDKVVGIILNFIYTATNFQENVRNSISHEQTISVIDHLIEKTQMAIMNLNNYIQNLEVRDSIREKIKGDILNTFNLNANKENELNLNGITEEELKNNLDMIW